METLIVELFILILNQVVSTFSEEGWKVEFEGELKMKKDRKIGKIQKAVLLNDFVVLGREEEDVVDDKLVLGVGESLELGIDLHDDLEGI